MAHAGRPCILGYTGVTRGVPLSQKIGDSDDRRNNKFARAGEDIIFGDGAPEYDGGFTTTIGVDSSKVTAKDYKIPHRSGVLAGVIDAQPKPVKFRAMTESQYALANYHAVSRKIMEYTNDEFDAAFSRIDADHSGFIDRAELRSLLRELKQNEPTDYEVSLFMTHFDKNADTRITRDEFRSGLDAIRAAARASIAHDRKREPAWKQAEQKRVVGTEPVQSSMALEIGKEGYRPADRPLVEGSGMNSTTKDLFTGTSKRTMHLPGYSGHIPESGHNPRASSQAVADGKRDTYLMKTNLRGTFNTRIPGYGGHRPLYGPDAARADVKKPTGQFAATEQAAADSLITAYWAERKAAGGQS